MLVNISKSIFLPALFLTVAVVDAKAQDRCVVTMQSTVTTSTGVHYTSYSEAYVYDSVDQPPCFPGGDSEMVKYINRQRRYPRKAYDANVQGRVVCSFVVTSKGDIENANVVRGVEPSLDEEALRIIRNMPNWVAGRIDDTPVPVYCIVTIPFRR